MLCVLCSHTAWVRCSTLSTIHAVYQTNHNSRVAQVHFSAIIDMHISRSKSPYVCVHLCFAQETRTTFQGWPWSDSASDQPTVRCPQSWAHTLQGVPSGRQRPDRLMRVAIVNYGLVVPFYFIDKRYLIMTAVFYCHICTPVWSFVLRLETRRRDVGGGSRHGSGRSGRNSGVP